MALSENEKAALSKASGWGGKQVCTKSYDKKNKNNVDQMF